MLYTKEIENIVHKHEIQIQTYADDCQIYLSFKSNQEQEANVKIKGCLNSIKSWMDYNFLKLNAEKTLVKVFKPKTSPLLDFKMLDTQSSDCIKVLGVFINGNLKFNKFISKKVQTCTLHLRNLYNIKHSLDRKTRTLLVTNLILSTVGYCNILLLNATDKDLKPLKIIINKSVRFIYDHSY